jgi:NACHT domain
VVSQEVDDRLRQSLHFVVEALLNLPKADNPGQVSRSPLVAKPWSMTVEDDRRAGFAILPEDLTIWQVFQQPEVKQQLLILGEPGSGKTTSMLEIAQGLVDVAQLDNTQPIPVLLNLSSWEQEQPIFEWVLGELKAKYGVRIDLGRDWLLAGKLFVLLDGLDEVRTDGQSDCAQQLNGWMCGDVEQRPVGLVVCCRVEEYERVVQQKLALGWAVCLQQLSMEQISDYLAQFELAAVTDESLRQIISQPLFLSMFGLVAQQNLFNLNDWQQRRTTLTRQSYLFDQYWGAVMQRELVSEVDKNRGKLSKTYENQALPSDISVEKALIFLAKSLEHDSQAEFLVERLSPSYLNAYEKMAYRFFYMLGVLLVLIPTAMFSSSLSNSLSSASSVKGGIINVSWQVICAGLIFAIPWLRYVFHMEKIYLAEQFSFRELILSIKDNWTFRIQVSAISSFLVLFRHIKENVGSEWINVLILILIPVSGVMINTSISWIFIHSQVQICESKTVNQGVKNSLKNTLILIFTAVLIFSIIGARLLLGISSIVEDDNIIPIVFTYSVYIIIIAFFEGGIGFLQHIALRLVLWQNGYAPPRYDLLLNYCTERLLLQRIGGRYRFMHKLLQDHFAAMDLD